MWALAGEAAPAPQAPDKEEQDALAKGLEDLANGRVRSLEDIEADIGVSQAEAPRPSAPGIADVVQVHHWESRPSAPICGQVDEQIMVANYPKSADEIRRVAESRPSAEEVEKMAREWLVKNEIEFYGKERGYRGLNKEKMLAAFYRWMQERITRP